VRGTKDIQTDGSGVTEATVLVVDDKQDLADLYTVWLSTDHDVRTAYNGTEALEKADEDVDLMFLDRRMPDLSGDEVLEEVRDRGLDCRVVMVTAVDPDMEIVQMPFDDYLTKPISSEDLEETVRSMQEREQSPELVQEYLTLTSKKATLEAEQSPVELQENEEYQQLVQRVEELAEKADADVPQ
jgi:DNA-binding response OmpR family regulator